MIDYDRLTQKAMLHVIRGALSIIEKGGKDKREIYIVFETKVHGVHVPDYLAREYPDEMTVVISNNFSDLVVDHDAFSISLSFDGIMEYIRIPYSSIRFFSDPKAEFEMNFAPDTKEQIKLTKTDYIIDSSEMQNFSDIEGDPELDNLIDLSKFRR